jgi:hypothetical protein
MIYLLLRLLGKLGTNICSRTQAHQPEKRGIEFRHRKVTVNRIYKDNAEYDRPNNHLEAVKTHTIPVAEYVSQ